MLGLTVGTVRNNMNWEKGTRIIDKDSGNRKITVYLIEKDGIFRIQALNSQLGPKGLHPDVKLINRSLYDLIPGRIHAIDVNTLEDFGNYANQRELWKSLNPNSLYEFNKLTLTKQRSYLDNRISRFMIIAKPGGVSTELGNFYFCRHPDFLPGKTKIASAFFGVNVNTGVVEEYFENNSQPLDDRLTVRIHRKNNTICLLKEVFENTLIKMYFLNNFLMLFLSKFTYKLTQEQLGNLPLNKD